MKKIFSLVIIGLLLIMSMLAAGCSNQASNSNQTADTKGSADSKANEQKEEKTSPQFPTKPIEIIVPFAAGGGTDSVARALAESLKPILGQDVVVSNKTGGSGAVGMNEGLQAKADGYKITMATREIVSLPLMGLAPFKSSDFKYIGNVNRDPALFVVSSKSKYQTFDDLVADIKANPGKVKFASSSTPSLYAIPFALAGNLDFVTIPFQGTGLAVVEVLAGRAEFGLYGPGEIKAQIESGELRPLAVMSENRLEGFFKDVPTVKEKGINVDWAGTYRGLAVPDGTPDEVVKILEDAVGKAVKDQKFIDFMSKTNLFIEYKSAADFNAMIEKDIKDLEPIVEEVKKQKK